MTTSDNDWKEINALIRNAARKNRGYAGFFDWPDRDQKELGILLQLFESLEAKEGLKYRQVRSRGVGNDPPDCESRDEDGRLIGIEVTELVDPEAIRRHKSGRHFDWAAWDERKFVEYLTNRITAKDNPSEMKGGPYAEYWLLIHCDEPELPGDQVREYLKSVSGFQTRLLTSIFLLLSYHPNEGYPYFRVPIRSAA